MSPFATDVVGLGGGETGMVAAGELDGSEAEMDGAAVLSGLFGTCETSLSLAGPPESLDAPRRSAAITTTAASTMATTAIPATVRTLADFLERPALAEGARDRGNALMATLVPTGADIG
jgi:hypothetical protein